MHCLIKLSLSSKLEIINEELVLRYFVQILWTIICIIIKQSF